MLTLALNRESTANARKVSRKKTKKAAVNVQEIAQSVIQVGCSFVVFVTAP